MTTLPASGQNSAAKVGFLASVGAFLIWGLLAPVYFKLLDGVGALEIVAHRVVWTVLLVGIVVLVRMGPAGFIRSIGTWQRLGILVATTALISTNWSIFIWAVVNNQLLQSSLGYYINPLVNVLLGVVFLKERLSRRQSLAVLLAALGVTGLVVQHGAMPWIALSLATTFGFYGLLRKKVLIDALPGLVVETGLLVPVALGYLLWLGPAGSFASQGIGHDLMLVLSGPVTAIPLLLFVVGATRLKLSTIGLLQYIGPTGQLLLGVLVYGESFTTGHAVAFACIWLALILYSSEAFTTRHTPHDNKKSVAAD
jgi:chloramphenicol-sensitive protein RarD